MSTTGVRTVTFNSNTIRDTAVRNGASYENAKMVKAVKRALNGTTQQISQQFSITFLENKDLKVNQWKYNANTETAKKITAIFQRAKDRNKVWNAVTSPTEKTTAPKPKGINPLDKPYTWLRKTNAHCIAADIVEILLFGLAAVAFGLVLFSHGGNFNSAVHFANVGFASTKYIFGGLNFLIGGILLHQSIINMKKALKSKNKKEIGIAVAGMVFSLVILSLGVTSVGNLANNHVFKIQLGICCGFAVALGLYNLNRIRMLKKELEKSEDLEAFLQKKLQITDKEHLEIEKRINDLNPVQLFNKLKSLKKWNSRFTREQLQTILHKRLEDLNRILLLTELEMMQERKKADLESLLGKELTQKAINYLNGNKTTLTKETVLKEIRRKIVVETLRVSAPLLGLGGFAANLMIRVALLANFVFYSSMLSSKVLGFYLNLKNRDRNVPTEEGVTKERLSVYELLEHLNPQPA